MGVAAGAYATYIIIVANKQVVKGNELTKKSLGDLAVTSFKDNQASVQSPATAKIVAKIKRAIK